MMLRDLLIVLAPLGRQGALPRGLLIGFASLGRQDAAR